MKAKGVKIIDSAELGGAKVFLICDRDGRWLVQRAGMFGYRLGLVNKNHGNDKYAAIAHFTELKREVAVRFAMRALGVEQ